MEVTINQALDMLQRLYEARDFSLLATRAGEVVQQRPETPIAWRYLGIARACSSGGGGDCLHRAAAAGDTEAAIWLGVIAEFTAQRSGSLTAANLIFQVSLIKLRRSVYLDYPSEVSFETQAVCNAACSFCPYPTMERKGDYMPDALIEKIISDLKEIPGHVPFTISPFKVSDPFLDKRIFHVCERVNQELPNAKLRLFTNGSPLTARMVEKIAGIKNVVHLWVSLNETEKAAYESLMQLPFDKLIAKLDHLHEQVLAGYPHPVVLSRVCDGSATDQRFIEFVRQRYPEFDQFLIGRSDWAGQIDTGLQKAIPPTGCVRWFELSIMASGKVALCCMDGEGKHVIGDINHQSILEIYNTKDYRKMRQHTFSRLAAAAPCDVCVY